MTLAVPTDVKWGVQWSVFVVPEGEMLGRPVAPEPMSEEPTEDEQAAWAQFLEADAAFEAKMVTLTGDDANWFPTVAEYADEDEARQGLADLRSANEGNPFNRDFVLVYAPPRTWTVVED